MRRVRFKVEEIPGRELRPGDLFSTAGPEVWDHVDARRSIGEKIYIRTNAPEDQATDGHLPIYRVVLEIRHEDGEFDPGDPLGTCGCGSEAVVVLEGEPLCRCCYDVAQQVREKQIRRGTDPVAAFEASIRDLPPLTHSDGSVARSGFEFLMETRAEAGDEGAQAVVGHDVLRGAGAAADGDGDDHEDDVRPDTEEGDR